MAHAFPSHDSHSSDAESIESDSSKSASLKSTSFVGLLIAQVLGMFNDHLLRWFSVPIAEHLIGKEKAIVIGGLCITLPYLLFTPMAGWLADRFPKRNVILYCKIAEVIVMFLTLLAMVYGNVWMLFTCVFLLGTQAALFGPAKFGSIPEILPTRLLSKANGIIAMATIVATGVGGILAWELYSHGEPTLGTGDWSRIWTLTLVIGISSLIGVISCLPIRTAPASRHPRRFAWNPIREIRPAMQEIFRDRHLLGTALGIAWFFFVAILIQQLIPIFSETVLGMPQAKNGFLLGIVLAGVAVGGVLAGIWSDGKIELGIVPIGAATVCGAILFSFACCLFQDLVGSDFGAGVAFWGSCLGMFFFGIGGGLYSIPLEAYLQYRSPSEKRGLILGGSFFLTYVLILGALGAFYLLSGLLKVPAHYILLILGLVNIPVFFISIRILATRALWFALWLMARVCYRVRVHGLQNIPTQQSFVVVSNHASFADGQILLSALPRFVRFIIYADFTRMPLLETLGKIMRVIPIKASEGPTSLVRSIQTARTALKDGEAVCIFAEGGLTRTGQLQPFQRGVSKILQGSDAVVVPVFIRGLWGSIFSWRGGKVFKKWPKRLRPVVNLYFGEPLETHDSVQIRLAVERLGAKAAIMEYAKDTLTPVRLFVRHCKQHKSDPKIACTSGVELNSGRVLAASIAMMRVLNRKYLKSSERRVALLVPPSVGGALANMAVSLSCRTSVNLNYTLSEDVVQYCVEKADVKHVITSRKFLEKKPFNLKGVEFIYLEDVKQEITSADKAVAAFWTYIAPASMLEMAFGLDKIKPSDELSIIFTSGSTGEPKGVVLSNANVGSNIAAVNELLNFDRRDGILGVLPFFHSFGFTVSLWLPMCYQTRGVYHFNPLDAKIVGKLVEDHKLTIMLATPTFLKMYLRRCEKSNFESLKLIIVGAEKLPVDLAHEFKERFGILPTEGYGTTELSPVASVNVPDHISKNVTQIGSKLGTVGRPIPGVTFKIVDPESFVEQPIGNEGLVLVTGPNVMLGYLDEPEKTAQVIIDGWYNTGDFGKLDTDGFVTITGRQSRFSKIAGEMVPHIRIEQELYKICEPSDSDEALLTLAVTAVPDSLRGERVIVLYTKLTKPVDQVIKDLAATGMPKLWIPSADSFVQVEVIPILGTGKLDLRGIKDMAHSACSETVINS